MKKTVLSTLVVAGLLACAPMANAQGLYVADPTPEGSFSGTYHCGYEWKWNETTKQWEEDESRPAYCTQEGGVYAGTDGVTACNGNENLRRPDDQSPLQGYIWIGPGAAASNPTAASPGNIIGAGNNHEDDDGPTGSGACRQGYSSPPAKPTAPPA